MAQAVEHCPSCDGHACEGTRGVSSSDVPGGSRVSAETRSDPTVRTERFIAYVERVIEALDLDAPGRVTEVINRAVLENYRTIARGEYELIRSSVEFAVEVLRRKPDLLADLLQQAEGYERHRVIVVAGTVPEDGRVRGLVRDAVVRVDDAGDAGGDAS